MQFFLLIFLFVPAILSASSISYSVDFEGVDHEAILKTLHAVSGLRSNKKAPSSVNALRYRAESDVPEILKVLRAAGYYDATVQMQIDNLGKEFQVKILIEQGTLYTIETFDVTMSYHGSSLICDEIELKKTGIKLGKPAVAQKILEAELLLMQQFSENGYPLATLSEREILVDTKSKTVRIHLTVDTGPIAYFGEAMLQGDTKIAPRFVQKKIAWKKEELYDSRKIELTQKKLMETGLFSSSLITHTHQTLSDQSLPLLIELTDNKQRSVNLGASYQTFYGFGLTFGWENRNINALGRTLSLQGDITKRTHAGLATYMIPDFKRTNQDFINQLQAMYEAITPYAMRSYNAVSRIERKVNETWRFSCGGKIEKLYVSQSVENGRFFLCELPLYLRRSSANSLLNPTEGMSIEYTMTPSLNVEKSPSGYLIQKLCSSLYLPCTKSHRIVIAQKVTLGSIASPHLNNVPVPKRFFGGSEEDLRGYRYQSVSQLKGNQPIGGRAALYYTLETRFRLCEAIGLVPFLDLGRVYETILPTLHGKWFKSVGLGVRYFSFLGPLRCDLAFPLDRRKEIDPYYRILLSIGQMF